MLRVMRALRSVCNCQSLSHRVAHCNLQNLDFFNTDFSFSIDLFAVFITFLYMVNRTKEPQDGLLLFLYILL